MHRKYFSKNQGVLSRKFVASGLAAVFSSGMFGSYAGAMEPAQNLEFNFVKNEKTKLVNVLEEDSIKADENAREVFKFFNEIPKLPAQDSMFAIWRDKVKNGHILLADKNFLIRVYTYLLLYKFREFEDGTGINDFLKKSESSTLTKYFENVLIFLLDDVAAILLNKIEEGWGKDLLEEVKKEKLKENDYKEIDLSGKVVSAEEIDKLLETDEQKLDKNIKNKSMEFGIGFSYDKQSNSKNTILLNNSYGTQPEMPHKKDLKRGKKEEKKVISEKNDLEKDNKEVNLLEKLEKEILDKNIKNKSMEFGIGFSYDKQSNSKNTILLNNGYGPQPEKPYKKVIKSGKLDEKEIKQQDKDLLKGITKENIKNTEAFLKEKKEVEDKKNLKEENEKEENEQNDLEKDNEEIEEFLEEKKIIGKQKLGENIKNKTKNKVKKMIVVVPVIILLALIIKTLAVKGKSNTDNNNKDDEKVNPPINPETPLTDPESDEQNPEQKKQEQGSQEQKPSVVPNNILKVTGATVAAGGLAGGGSYLVNEVVLKRGKSSNVSPKNGDDKYVYLDYDGNEKEIENENNNDDSKDAITSDLSSKQSYEGKKEKRRGRGRN